MQGGINPGASLTRSLRSLESTENAEKAGEEFFGEAEAEPRGPSLSLNNPPFFPAFTAFSWFLCVPRELK